MLLARSGPTGECGASGEGFEAKLVLPGAPQNIHRIQRAFRRLLVLEVSKHVASGGEMFLHSSHHRLAFVGGVVRFAIAIVSVVGSDYVRSISLFSLGDAERDVALP